MAPLPRRRPREPLPGVLADLPASVATRLDTAPIAAAARALLAADWRPVQLGARIGALPVTDDPASQVQAFLAALSDEETPVGRADRERAERAATARTEQAAREAAGPPASPETIARCLAQVRSQLLLQRRRPPVRRGQEVRPARDPVAAGPHPAADFPVDHPPDDG